MIVEICWEKGASGYFTLICLGNYRIGVCFDDSIQPIRQIIVLFQPIFWWIYAQNQSHRHFLQRLLFLDLDDEPIDL